MLRPSAAAEQSLFPAITDGKPVPIWYWVAGTERAFLRYPGRDGSRSRAVRAPRPRRARRGGRRGPLGRHRRAPRSRGAGDAAAFGKAADRGRRRRAGGSEAAPAAGPRLALVHRQGAHRRRRRVLSTDLWGHHLQPAGRHVPVPPGHALRSRERGAAAHDVRDRATPSAADGRPLVRIDEATVGGVPLPDAARDAIAADLQKAIASLLPANLQITSVTVATGALAVKGVANP